MQYGNAGKRAANPQRNRPRWTGVKTSWGAGRLASVVALTSAAVMGGFAGPAAGADVAAPVVLSTPVGGSTVGEELTLTADAAEGTSVYYEVSQPGARVSILGPFTTAPFATTYDASTGPLTVTAFTCPSGVTPTGQSKCADAATSTATVSVARMVPRLLSVDSAFSPNRDGRRDTAAITYALDEASSVFLTVLSQGEVVGVSPLSARVQAAGRHTARWDGRAIAVVGDGALQRVRDGRYVVMLTTRRQLADSVQYGWSTGMRVTVDTTAGMVSVSPDGRLFFVRDGYRDSAVLGVRTSGAGKFTVQVRNGAGKVVRTLTGTTGQGGEGGVRWNGRTKAGEVLRAGTYSATASFMDEVGNMGRSGPAKVILDGRYLVKRTGTKTVNPSSSAYYSLENDCNHVYYWFNKAGSLALDSIAGCQMVFQSNLAASQHKVRLPAALMYGSARVVVVGNRLKSGTVLLGLDNDSGYSAGEAVLVKGDNGATPRMRFSTLRTAPRVRWTISAHDGADYIVDKFRVEWTYFTLNR